MSDEQTPEQRLNHKNAEEDLQERASELPCEAVAGTAVASGEAGEGRSADQHSSGDESGGGGLWPTDRMKPVLEALLFASGDPLPVRKVCEILENAVPAEVKATLAELDKELLTHGIRLAEVAGGWQLRTAPEFHGYVRKLFPQRPARLTRAAMETLTIVAYKQPATRADVEAVRGVDSGAVMETLVERRLLKVIGRKDVPGRPLVYATSKNFLEFVGLKSLRDLPTLPELGDDVAGMASASGFDDIGADDAAILPLEGDGGETQQESGPQDRGEAGPPDEEGSEPQNQDGNGRQSREGSGP